MFHFFPKKKENNQENTAPQKALSVSDIMSELNLSVLAISDLHTCFKEDMEVVKKILKTEQLDCVLLLGDIVLEDAKEIAETATVPCYYVLGNHDYWGQNDGVKNLTDLDGRTVEVNGVRISGFASGPRYKSGNFAMRTEEEAREVISRLGDSEIFVSHESPYHLLSPAHSHAGFQAITDYVSEKKPRLHIFGHHHWREEIQNGDTLEVCIYKCAKLSADGVRYIL